MVIDHFVDVKLAVVGQFVHQICFDPALQRRPRVFSVLLCDEIAVASRLVPKLVGYRFLLHFLLLSCVLGLPMFG